MGAVTVIAQCVIVCCNIFVIIISILFIAIGGIILAPPSFVAQLLAIFDTYIQAIQTAAADAGATIDTSAFSITSLFSSFAIAFIVIGVVLFIIGICGCCGACCKVKVMLIIYVVVLLILLISQIVFVCLIYTSPQAFEPTLKASFRNNLNNDYQGLKGTDVVSLTWNAIMLNLGCCGLDNYRDFSTASKWVNPITYQSVNYNLDMPVACCKTAPTSGAEMTCVQASDPNNNKDIGCWNKLWELLWGLLKSPGPIGFFVGILVFQAILAACAIWILVSIAKDRITPGVV